MGNFWQISVLILSLALFGVLEFHKNSGTQIIKVFSPSIIAVDRNRNNIIDEGEIICIPDVTTLTSDIKTDQTNFSKSLNLPPDDILRAGYMADTFARNTLENKKVKLIFSREHSPECKFAKIIVDGKDYKEKIENEGYGISNGIPQNPKLFTKNLEEARKLNLVLANPSSGKFHTLTCRFGLNSSDYVIMPKSDAEKLYKKCKYCFRPKKEIIKNLKTNLPPKPDIISEIPLKYPESLTLNDIKFLVSDYTDKRLTSRNCEHIFCKEMVNLINSSKSSIDMAIYGWAAIPKLDRAINEAEKRGVSVRIVYDITPGKEYYPETTDFIQKHTNTRSDEISGDSKLTSMLMHNKFIIVDNRTVWTGSMNFSTTGLSGFNANNVIIVNSPELAKIYTKEFEQMYSGKFHTLKEKNPDWQTVTSGSAKIKVYFSPQDKVIQNQVIPLINNAQNYIYIPAFVITHYELSKALIDAKNRNIDIKIITDATSSGMSHNKISELRKAGISLKSEIFAGKMHSKSIIIDDKFVITGSMNFSNSGENKNDENCLIIENPELAKFYRGYFEYIWAKIPQKWLYINARAESKDSIGSCSDGLDNDYDGKIDSQDSGCN